MANKIGRLVSLGIGKETTAGTETSTYTWIPMTISPFIKPMNEYIDNENGIGRIEGSNGQELSKSESETQLEGWVGQLTFGHIMTALFGTSSAGSLIETGVYKHSFTVANTNSHKSYSIITDGTTQNLSLYNMLDSVAINAEVGDVVKFSSNMKGKAVNTTTGKTVAFTAEDYFKVADMTVKFATDTAGLTAAPAVALQTVNFEVSKNVTSIFGTGSIEPSSIHNQQVAIAGDFEALFDDDTFKDYVTGGTNKAMRITIVGDTLIGATKYAELNFDFAQISMTEWDRTTDNNAIMSQTVGFTAGYDIADTAMIVGYIQNTQSSQY